MRRTRPQAFRSDRRLDARDAASSRRQPTCSSTPRRPCARRSPQSAHRIDVEHLEDSRRTARAERHRRSRSSRPAGRCFADLYRDNRTTGSLILIDPADQRHRRRGDDPRISRCATKPSRATSATGALLELGNREPSSPPTRTVPASSRGACVLRTACPCLATAGSPSRASALSSHRRATHPIRISSPQCHAELDALTTSHPTSRRHSSRTATPQSYSCTGDQLMTTRTPTTESEERCRAAQLFCADRLASAQNACVTSSFQAEDVVVLTWCATSPARSRALSRNRLPLPRNLDYRDRIAAEWNLNLVNVLPEHTVAEQESQFGILNQTAPDRCCGMRKVEPLFRSLDRTTYGSPACAASNRSRAPTCRPKRHSRCPPAKTHKLSPLAEWTTRDVWHYAEAHGIPAAAALRRATPASAASHVPACPSIPTIPAPAAGPATNWSAAFTFRH